MTTITRFAPSPTGRLHVGNMRTAIIAYCIAKQAKQNNGKFILRIDDTDQQRSKEEYVKQIEKDLKECGMFWDEEFKQSEKIDRYNEVKNELIKSGRLYPCYETSEELEIERKLCMKNNKPFIYNNNRRALTDEKKISSCKPHWRFKLDENKNIFWNDGVKGELRFDTKLLSDPVVIRADGTFTYLLISVIDDVDSNVNYVVRGEDHITNTASQIQMWEALGAEVPKLAHLALLKMPDGKISKRKGGFEIEELLKSGIMPITIWNYLSRLGTSKNVDDILLSQDELIKDFDIRSCSSSSPNFDEEKLESLNMKIAKSLDFDSVQSFLKSKLNIEVDEELWKIVKDNIESFEGLKYWKEICCGKVDCQLSDEEKNNLKKIAKLGLQFFPKDSLDSLDSLDLNSWSLWVNEIFKEDPSISKKDIYHGLRKIITGKDKGPEMKKFIIRIGEKNLKKILKNFLLPVEQ